MTYENKNPENLPPLDPNLPPQTPFELVADHESLEMNAEGFKFHTTEHPRLENTDSELSELFPTDGGSLRLIGDEVHLRPEAATPRRVAALFAGHIATRTGENVIIGSGIVSERNDDGEYIERPRTLMPIGSYVEELKANPDQLYAPEYTDFNFAVQDLYDSGRMVMPQEMKLNPQDQLVAAHAARRILEDDDNHKFPEKPPQPSKTTVDRQISDMEASLNAATSREFDQIVQGTNLPDAPTGRR